MIQPGIEPIQDGADPQMHTLDNMSSSDSDDQGGPPVKRQRRFAFKNLAQRISEVSRMGCCVPLPGCIELIGGLAEAMHAFWVQQVSQSAAASCQQRRNGSQIPLEGTKKQRSPGGGRPLSRAPEASVSALR